MKKKWVLKKRNGRGDAVTIGVVVNEILRWIAPNGTTYWILCATDGKVYKTEKEAEKGLKEYQRNWDSSDFYHLEGNIIKFKG